MSHRSAPLACLLAVGACAAQPEPPQALNPGFDATYIIAGQPVTLVGGEAAEPTAPGAAAMIVTRHFGNALRHDIDGDGHLDVVFVLARSAGGSGTWFYVVAALDRPEGWLGSHGMLLGDRIAPQSIEPGPGQHVIVNFADRAPGEPFSTPPSQAKSLRLRFNPETLDFGVVAQDYPGAADPRRMTLDMHRWTWLGHTGEDGVLRPPAHETAFTLAFRPDGRLEATTDCNRISGSYTVEACQLSLLPMASTRMACEGSQESLYLELLQDVEAFEFTGRGRLVLTFATRPGSISFR